MLIWKKQISIVFFAIFEKSCTFAHQLRINMSIHFKTLFIVAFIGLLTACQGGTIGARTSLSANSLGARSSTPAVEDSLYTERSAMSLYTTDPERTLVLLDSAVIVGNITPSWGKCLQAMTYYAGLQDYPTARRLCYEVLSEDDADDYTLENTYAMLTRLSYSEQRWADVVRFAEKTAELAMRLDMTDDILEARVTSGFALVQTGQVEDGLKKMNEATDELYSMPSFSAAVAYLNSAKKLLLAYRSLSRPRDVLQVAELMQRKIDEVVNPATKDESAPSDLSGFEDFHRGIVYAHTATAYAMSDDIEQAMLYEQLTAQTHWGQTLNGAKTLAQTYFLLHQWSELDAALQQLEQWYLGAQSPASASIDTISDGYLNLLQLRAQWAHAQGKTEDENAYLKRSLALLDSIHHRRHNDHIAEVATLYQLHETEHSHHKAEHRATLWYTIACGLAVMLIVVILFALFINRQRRLIAKKNHALVEMMSHGTHADAVSTPAAEVGTQTASLLEKDGAESHFRYIDSTIRSERLYADPLLQRQTILDHFGLKKEELTQILNNYAGGLSFPNYINALRIEDACRLLQEQPDTTINSIAEQVGLTPRNFRRLFTDRYAMTPTEYRNEITSIKQ